MEEKAQNHRYQDMLLQANEALLFQELEKNMLREAMCADLYSYRCSEAIHKDHDERLRREIVDLKAQVDRDQKYEHIKVRLGRHCRAQEMELKEMRARNVSNKGHLIEFMRVAHYLQDTMKRVCKA